MRRALFIKTMLATVISMSALSCKKKNNREELSSWRSDFICEVNGVPYRDLKPWILPPGVLRTPWSRYEFKERESTGRFFFHSNAMLEKNSTTGYASRYGITVELPLNSRLEAGKEYLFEAIEGEDYRMPVNHEFLYRNKGLAYCSVVADGDLNNICFGTGKFIVDTLDEDKELLTGVLEFTVPSSVLEDDKKLLNIKGRFRCDILDW